MAVGANSKINLRLDFLSVNRLVTFNNGFGFAIDHDIFHRSQFRTIMEFS